MGVCLNGPYFEGWTPRQVADLGRALKKDLPGIQFWGAFVEKPRGQLQTNPVPDEVDVIVVSQYYDTTPAAVRAKADECLPDWLAKARGRPVLLRWVATAGKTSQPGTQRACVEIAKKHRLAGVLFASYGGDPNRPGNGIDAQPAVIQEIKDLAVELGFSKRPMPTGGVGTNIVPAPPNMSRVELATHIAGGLLFKQESSAEWKLVRPQTRVPSGARLVSLPAARSQVQLDSQVHLELVGSLPVTGEKTLPALESAVTLHETAAVDLDLTLQSGRLLIRHTRPSGSAAVRVRFDRQVWDLKLPQPHSSVGLEVSASNYSQPAPGLRIVGHQGPVEFTPVQSRHRTAPFGGRIDTDRFVILYDNGSAAAGTYAAPKVRRPDWLDSVALFDDADDGKAVADLQASVTSKPIDLALAEMMAGSRPAARRLAVFAAGALDDIPVVFDALEDERRADLRQAARTTLLHWYRRRENSEERLRQIMRKQTRFFEDETSRLVRLLRYEAESAELKRFLLDCLTHSRLAVRELAFARLCDLIPSTSDRALTRRPPKRNVARGPKPGESGWRVGRRRQRGSCPLAAW